MKKVPMAVNQMAIKKMLEKDVAPYRISILQRIPLRVVADIKKGKKVYGFIKEVEETEYCECCHLRKKAKGFRKLCLSCWKADGIPGQNSGYNSFDDPWSEFKSIGMNEIEALNL